MRDGVIGVRAVAGAAPSTSVMNPVAGALLAAGGLALLGWLGWTGLAPEPPPYGYHEVVEGGVESFPELGLQGQGLGNLRIRRYELRVPGLDSPVALLHTGRDSAEREVLLDWTNLVSEPVLSLMAPAQELGTLVQSVSRYLPADAVVLASWDVSRQLSLLSGADAVFDEHLGRPLLIPETWSARRDSIEALEHAKWGGGATPSVQTLYDQYVDALLSEPVPGTEQLRHLAGGREAFLVLHLVDAYRLGVMAPERLGVGYKDFPRAGDTHKMVAGARSWLAEQGYGSYTVDPGIKDRTRVYFLTDTSSSNTLLARALPFSTSDPSELPGLSLAYQHGGFWVYRLAPEEGSGQAGLKQEAHQRL